MRLPRQALTAAVAASLILPGALASPALAATPGALRDLVGARAGQAEGAVTSRGYTHARTQKTGDSSWSYWTRGDECVRIITTDGRYAAIDGVDRSDCRSGGGSDATAAVAAVAIIGLAAALAAHNKHEHDRAAGHDEEYSRGYQDGLDDAHYDRHDSEGYHDGYLAGEAERSNRRASNTRWVRGAPQAAQDACARRGDAYQNAPAGSSVAVGVASAGADRYDITVATGQYRSRCLVTAQGRVIEMNPY